MTVKVTDVGSVVIDFVGPEEGSPVTGMVLGEVDGLLVGPETCVDVVGLDVGVDDIGDSVGTVDGELVG